MKTPVHTDNRLTRLETALRRQRVALVFVTVLAGGMGLVAFTAPMPDVITARRFSLVDAGGKERGYLAMDERGPTLVIENAEGRELLRLAESGKGGGLLALNDEEGARRIGLIAHSTLVEFAMGNRQGEPFAEVFMGDKGGPQLNLIGLTGGIRLAAGPPGIQALEYKDGGGASLVSLLSAPGATGMVIGDPEVAGARISLMIVGDNPAITVTDAVGQQVSVKP